MCEYAGRVAHVNRTVVATAGRVLSVMIALAPVEIIE